MNRSKWEFRQSLVFLGLIMIVHATPACGETRRIFWGRVLVADIPLDPRAQGQWTQIKTPDLLQTQEACQKHLAWYMKEVLDRTPGLTRIGDNGFALTLQDGRILLSSLFCLPDAVDPRKSNPRARNETRSPR